MQLAASTWDRSSKMRFEYFRNDQEIDDSSRFEVVLARSVMNLTVDPGRSILETVRDAGVKVPSSCEQRGEEADSRGVRRRTYLGPGA
ncbi:hypothetical protein [Saccharopolyspora shandongensis]|uniref:hypothetical protein n=1 Tax=Saccharopolyspora shandongensis TaxID=418495 RepID=UPI0033F05E9F